MPKDWSSDVPISMPMAPDPVDDPIQIVLGNTGFAMTSSSMVHNITPAQVEEVQHPAATPFAPFGEDGHAPVAQPDQANRPRRHSIMPQEPPHGP